MVEIWFSVLAKRDFDKGQGKHRDGLYMRHLNLEHIRCNLRKCGLRKGVTAAQMDQTLGSFRGFTKTPARSWLRWIMDGDEEELAEGINPAGGF
jgi:hypothetical protein